jgi:low temperature requirement protein LtrA
MQSFCSLNSLKYYNECRREKGRIGLYSLWLFGHFPLVVAITSVGVGLGHITSNAHELALTYSEQWLVCGSVALSLGGLKGYYTSHLHIITCMLALLRIIAPVENGQHIE